jgi:hypothetical protein
MGMSPKRWGYERRIFAGATGRSKKRAQKLLGERFSGADFPSKEETSAALIEILRSLPPQDPNGRKGLPGHHDSERPTARAYRI